MCAIVVEEADKTENEQCADYMKKKISMKMHSMQTILLWEKNLKPIFKI